MSVKECTFSATHTDIHCTWTCSTSNSTSNKATHCKEAEYTQSLLASHYFACTATGHITQTPDSPLHTKYHVSWTATAVATAVGHIHVPQNKMFQGFTGSFDNLTPKKFVLGQHWQMSGLQCTPVVSFLPTLFKFHSCDGKPRSWFWTKWIAWLKLST